MAISNKHQKEVQELSKQYEQVDTYLESFNPALAQPIKEALSADLKAKIVEEAKARSAGLINEILSDVHVKIEDDKKEAQEVKELLAQIEEINAKQPGAIAVPEEPTSKQLKKLIKDWKATQVDEEIKA
jgi:hypothetical protein